MQGHGMPLFRLGCIAGSPPGNVTQELGERIPGIERHSLMVNGEQQMEKSGRYDRILKPQLQLIRGLFLTRIISCLGANHELLVALLLRVHTDRSVAGNAFRREWLVTD